MPRTIIDIPNEQLHEVDRVCRALGISRAEAVRRSLDAFVSQNQAVQEEGFGLWQGAAADSVNLVQTIRGQW
jgi:metal-responsive CopG/Arc/MetJ family transcriptional regulator